MGLWGIQEQAQAATTSPADLTASIYDSAPVSADALPTVQIDGVAWTQAISGNTVFVGGEFTSARPAGSDAGTNLTSRTNLLAYDITTGALKAAWAPIANADIRGIAVSSDGSTVYVGGQFTQINGETRYRVAALDAQTGALVSSWQPEVNGRVDSLVVKDGVVYLGGQFSSVSGVARTRLAAVDNHGRPVRV